MNSDEKIQPEIGFEPVTPSECDAFIERMQKAFSAAVVETFGCLDDRKIPPADDVRKSFGDPACEIYHILHEKRQIGGVILKIDRATHRNSLDLFFISPNQHSKGLGLAAWRKIEKMHPETQVWETCTPYFEKRNIHFYVNKCGFKITGFFNQHYPAPEGPTDFDFFVFEKDMRSSE